MKKPNITPGEWSLSPGLVVSKDEKGSDTLICDVDYLGSDKEEEVANARAISAVPDMIDALVEVYYVIESVVNTWGKRRELHDMYPTLEQIESALIKAGVEL